MAYFFVVLRKEILDNLRDWKSILAMLFPPLIFPLIMFLLDHSSLISNTSNSSLLVGDQSLVAGISTLFLIELISGSGAGIAVDILTGEKERHSLESLLMTQSPRSAIYLAKLFTVFCYILTEFFITMIIYASVVLMYDSSNILDSKTVNINLPIHINCIIVLCIVYSFFIASQLCFLAVISKNIRTSQAVINTFCLCPIVLCSASLLMADSIGFSICFLPIVNISYSIYLIIKGLYSFSIVSVTVISTLCYGIGLSIIGTQLLSKEKTIYES